MPQWPILKNRSPTVGTETGASGSPPVEQELIIGNSLRFRGDLDVNADLRIEGTVKGCISAGCHTVTVATDGLAEANIHAGSVVVRGRVRGAIIAKGSVRLEASARVEGPIHAARVVLEEGCQLDGRIDVSTADVGDPLAGGQRDH